jgi:hypothetical protein
LGRDRCRSWRSSDAIISAARVPHMQYVNLCAEWVILNNRWRPPRLLDSLTVGWQHQVPLTIRLSSCIIFVWRFLLANAATARPLRLAIPMHVFFVQLKISVAWAATSRWVKARSSRQLERDLHTVIGISNTHSSLPHTRAGPSKNSQIKLWEVHKFRVH